LSRWREIVLKILDYLLIAAGVAALAGLIAEYGFYLSYADEARLQRFDLLILFVFILHYFLKVAFVKDRLLYLKQHWFQAVLVVIILSETAFIINTLGFSLVKRFFFDINVRAITKITIIWAQILIVLSLIHGSVAYNRKIVSLKFHPAQLLLFSFVFVILTGSALLSLPRAVAPGETLSYLDALFTSTSATCVTGLVVVNTGTHFSFIGQLIILFLIQIGALGIMTLASFFALFFRQGISIRERAVLGEMMNIDSLNMINRTLKQIVTITFSVEAAGALLLFMFWNKAEWTFNEHLYQSVFHSVSAFCNAGFSLNRDSLISYNNNYPVLLTIAGLIIIGGLGFVVIAELTGIKLSNRQKERTIKRWGVQTKLVLLISSLLIIGGTILFYIVEPGSGQPFHDLIQAFFSSVTARTAGFNSVDFVSISVPASLLIMILMFIGASPGSAGGGIKTTTIGVLFGSLLMTISGRNRIVIFKKNITFTVLNRALVVFAFSITIILLSTFILTITEPFSFLDLLFEEISAFATVGLSRGITADLSEAGEIVLILSMLIGRIGAMTMAFAITAPKEQVKVEYPTEKSIMIG
jgi:potassium uptake TrkH family protein